MNAPQAVARARAMGDLYRTNTGNAAMRFLQYRLATLLVLVGFLTEPVVYLVVWRAVVEANGGNVAGYDAGAMSAYFIVWTLVRTVNMVYTPYGFERRIRTGYFSGRLVLPAHPIHFDLSDFAGGKVVQILMWVPIAVPLVLLFRPTLHPSPVDIMVFAFAAVGAYLMRSLLLWLLGMVTFWTTRVTALFEIVLMAELLLSGRLVPLAFMPDWAQTLANLLPFKWTFGFPIEVAVSDLSGEELLGGLAMQAVWTVILAGAVSLVWKRAVRRYTAVNN